MKVSIKVTYGLRFLLYLAKSDSNKFIKINEVAHDENISEKYLENVVSIIKASGIIKVKRGAHGGYKLSKAPEQITLKEIFIALNGPVLVSEGTKDTIISRVVENSLNDLKNNIAEYLQNISLGDLLNKYKKDIEDTNHMFYI